MGEGASDAKGTGCGKLDFASCANQRCKGFLEHSQVGHRICCEVRAYFEIGGRGVDLLDDLELDGRSTRDAAVGGLLETASRVFREHHRTAKSRVTHPHPCLVLTPNRPGGGASQQHSEPRLPIACESIAEAFIVISTGIAPVQEPSNRNRSMITDVASRPP